MSVKSSPISKQKTSVQVRSWSMWLKLLHEMGISSNSSMVLVGSKDLCLFSFVSLRSEEEEEDDEEDDDDFFYRSDINTVPSINNFWIKNISDMVL